MSKPSRRPNREAIKLEIKKRKHAQKLLREHKVANGLNPSSHATIANHKCPFKTVEEEQTARVDAVTEQVRIMRAKLPVLLKRLSKIPDPRNPKKVKYQLTVLMIYGILTFVFQLASRREANREMTRPMFMKNLRMLFPEIGDLPHNDTLMRLLSKIEVDQIESAHIELIRQFIRKKKFLRYLIDNCYPIAIDGTQKFTRDWLWDEECSQRTFDKKDDPYTQYYVYVLEANLAFRDGMTIPLMSEFLSYIQGDTGNNKQDCETKAFYRLAERLKKEFPALRIMVLLDGLYATGPVMEICRKNKWQFMIVLQDDKLPTVRREYEALKGMELKNNLKRSWGDRRQRFEWANDIDYCYGPNTKNTQTIHVVECNEEWEEIPKGSTQVVCRSSRHVWISSEALNKWNVHERCNLGARSRWCIETGILVEKHHGYQYEHCHSYDWNAMKGYHYLMRLGHMFNVITRYSECFQKIVKELGVRGVIQFVRETLKGPWLNQEQIRERLAAPFQLRLV